MTFHIALCLALETSHGPTLNLGLNQAGWELPKIRPR